MLRARIVINNMISIYKQLPIFLPVQVEWGWGSKGSRNERGRRWRKDLV